MRKQAQYKLMALMGALLIGGITTPNTTHAQEGEEVAPVRFGVLGGANYNSVGVGGGTSLPIPASPDLSDGTGFGPYGGLLFEYNPGLGEVLGVHARVGYDDRSALFEATGASVDAGVSYFAFEPAMQLNLGSPNFHFIIGPSLNVLARNSFTVDTNGVTTENVEYGKLNDVTFGMWGGVNYDIHLSEMSDEGTQWYLTPFFEGSWMVDQVKTEGFEADNIDDSWSTVTVRGGLQLKYGFGGPQSAREEAPEVVYTDESPEVGVAITTPIGGVATPRVRQEYLPLLNYVFFDEGQTSSMPARYNRMSQAQAMSFSETELLPAPQPTAGASGNTGETTRSERQLQVYRNVTNIVGNRMRENTSAKITLVGSGKSAQEGRQRAELVKNYLVNSFGISSDRIEVKGQTVPPHASGTRVTPESDLPLVAEENNRVEILTSDDELLRPVKLNVYENEPIESDIILSVASNTRVSYWKVEIDGSGRKATYGPFYSNVARINAAPVLGDKKSGTYNARITAVAADGTEVYTTESFTLAKAQSDPEESSRYSILFEYDDSESLSKYEDFLRKTVAPKIADGSMVFIHGHTDVAGKEEYNAELSEARAEEAEKILADELKSLGRDVTFETYGLGESEYRSPFGNDDPEERYYNRTVMIEIVSPSLSMSSK